MKFTLSSAALQRAVLGASLAIGVAGTLSGAWLAAKANPDCLAGLIGGPVMIGIGTVGLRRPVPGRHHSPS